MLLWLIASFALAAPDPQSAPSDRVRAEELARSGHSMAALGLFEDIAGRDPSDVEARLWTARLKLRVGRTQEAETDFRSVIAEHPKDIDARIGLGATLTRKGQWAEAQAILEEVAKVDPRAKQVKVEDLIDRRYLDELDKSGLFAKLWNGKK